MKIKSDALANKKRGATLCMLLFFMATAFAQRAKQLSLMVIPSDNHLKRLGCLVEINPQGETGYQRNYQKAFIDDINLEYAVSAIQGKFAERGLLLLDLQQTLKSLPTEDATDDLEEVDRDPLSRALRAANPDIILDLTYEYQDKGMTKQLVYIFNAKDAYTNKAVVTVQHPGFEVTGKSLPEALAEQTEQNLQKFITGFQMYREDMDKDGREIILRVVSKEGAVSDFREDEFGTSGEPWNNWLLDWVEKNEKPGGKGSKCTREASKEQVFSIYIELFDANGKAISATDVARNLVKEIKLATGLKVTRSSKGLGEATIFVKPG